MRAVDLFAGAGGLSLGFQQAGFQLVAAVDNWEPAVRVYQANFQDHPVFCRDLGAMTGDEAVFTAAGADIIIGGPPCQDFSSAGKRDESGGRADLTTAFAAIVTRLRPPLFVMENVERASTSRTLATARTMFQHAGYGLSEVVLNASYCGVPQIRKRLFVIGVLGGQDGAVLPYLRKNLATRPMTVRDYFGDRLGVEHYYRHPRSYARRGVFSIDEPSPTIRGVNRPVPPGYVPRPGDTAHPSDSLRPLTTKERALIQTFPDDFVWIGSKADVEQIVGNAVPVKLAEYVAHCLLEYRAHVPIDLPVQAEQRVLQMSFL